MPFAAQEIFESQTQYEIMIRVDEIWFRLYAEQGPTDRAVMAQTAQRIVDMLSASPIITAVSARRISTGAETMTPTPTETETPPASPETPTEPVPEG